MGRRTTAGGPENSQQCQKYFLHYSTLASERPQFRTWGRRSCFLPRAPSNLVTPLPTILRIFFKLHVHLKRTVDWARVTKAGTRGSIPGRVIPKTWKTMFASCPTSYSVLLGGCKYARCLHWLAINAAFTTKVSDDRRVARGQLPPTISKVEPKFCRSFKKSTKLLKESNFSF